MNGKILPVLALALLGTEPCLAQTSGPRIEGIVVNGTQNEKPVAGAEVILRAGAEGSLQPVAQTITGRDGRFVLELPAEAEGIILPGANHQGVHYPGPRIPHLSGAKIPRVKLVVFEAVPSPNPLVVDLHEIDVHIHKGALEVTETLWINNPSLTTYVGQAATDSSLSTLSLTIPDGFERVTFHKEFLGRRFRLVEKRLVTDIPWTPGKREVKFTYHLPIEENKKSLEWSSDAPCSLVRLRLQGEDADRFESNLARVAKRDQSTFVFESSEAIMPAGQSITLQLGALPTPWIGYLRWSALGVLAGLILVTAGFRWKRRTHSPHKSGVEILADS
jgi:hypothetical protein